MQEISLLKYKREFREKLSKVLISAYKSMKIRD